MVRLVGLDSHSPLISPQVSKLSLQPELARCVTVSPFVPPLPGTLFQTGLLGLVQARYRSWTVPVGVVQYMADGGAAENSGAAHRPVLLEGTSK
jgi:hypothetical protein